MARITVAGRGVEYELLGREGDPAVALTPGGRFSKETVGLRGLGERLAAGGHRVLLWDRPNCGLSDLCLDAENESELHADTLLELIGTLELGPTALAAGSAGSRISLIAASRAPERVSRLAIWWVSGGPIGLMQLAMVYCGEPGHAAVRGGMAAVLQTGSWVEQAAMNPRTRDALLAMDPEDFVEKMQKWAPFYAPSPISPVPGMTAADFARLTMPVVIFQNGRSDLSHTRRTTEWVHELIPHSQLVQPPWPDDEWNQRSTTGGEPGRGLFENWPALAPQLLDFLAAPG